jgi:hypothetical protein
MPYIHRPVEDAVISIMTAQDRVLSEYGSEFVKEARVLLLLDWEGAHLDKGELKVVELYLKHWLNVDYEGEFYRC